MLSANKIRLISYFHLTQYHLYKKWKEAGLIWIFVLLHTNGIQPPMYNIWICFYQIVQLIIFSSESILVKKKHFWRKVLLIFIWF